MSMFNSTLKIFNAGIHICRINKQHLHSEQLKTCWSSSKMQLTLPSDFKITYCCNKRDCFRTSINLLSRLQTPIIVGCDAEWNFKEKVAVIQLCISPLECYVFHLSGIGFIPWPLKNIILNRWIVKVGVGIENDLNKICQDYLFTYKVVPSTYIDLGKYAFDLRIPHPKSKPNWSLKLLTETVLDRTINKNKQIKCSNWEDFPLNYDQLQYAATDSYVSLLLFNALEKHRKSKNLPIEYFPYLAKKLK